MTESAPSRCTILLQRWVGGDREAFDLLVPIVYQRLHDIAHQKVRYRGGGGSLNTTDLVHEAYLKLVDAPRVTIRDRSHFLALASR
ncbi:MAG: RNA polymerase subunit sigma-70, partial [Gemmatimonadetes bacterium HGW-Gemmatimonadetes-1]